MASRCGDCARSTRPAPPSSVASFATMSAGPARSPSPAPSISRVCPGRTAVPGMTGPSAAGRVVRTAYCATRSMPAARSGTARPAGVTRSAAVGWCARIPRTPSSRRRCPHLRIIDDDLWQQAQQRLAAEAAPATQNRGNTFWDRRRPKHLLSGKVFCGCCGRPFSAVGADYLAWLPPAPARAVPTAAGPPVDAGGAGPRCARAAG